MTAKNKSQKNIVANLMAKLDNPDAELWDKMTEYEAKNILDEFGYPAASTKNEAMEALVLYGGCVMRTKKPPSS